MFKLLALFTAAQAGWFSTFCERYLIADDPAQFEQAPAEWINRRIEALEIKRRWGKISRPDLSELQILLAEVRRRDFLEGLGNAAE